MSTFTINSCSVVFAKNVDLYAWQGFVFVTIRWLVNLHLDSGGPYNLTVYHRWLVNLKI